MLKKYNQILKSRLFYASQKTFLAIFLNSRRKCWKWIALCAKKTCSSTPSNNNNNNINQRKKT